MALASFIVAVIAVLFITGSTVSASTRPSVHPSSASVAVVPIVGPLPQLGPDDPNRTALNGRTDLVEAPSVSQGDAGDALSAEEPAVAAASASGGPTPIEKARLPIAVLALSYVGTYGGECWTFMQDVVKEATGGRVGTDYLRGFAKVGGYEISLEEARAGDVIQVLDERWTVGDISYPGLHTAIVIENHYDGTFTVVEANADWDGMVTKNAKYRPEKAIKGMPWMSIHVFRIPEVLTGRPGFASGLLDQTLTP
jgi:hypothetical protein